MIRNILIGVSAFIITVFSEIIILMLKGKAYWSGMMLMYLKHIVYDWTVYIVVFAWFSYEIYKHVSLQYKMRGGAGFFNK